MKKLIMWNAITLDGCFEGEKSWDLGFHELVWGPELEQLSLEQLRSAEALVFGKTTYEGMAAYWQTAEGEIAGYMNSIKKIACSRTLHNPEWNNTIIARDAVAEIKKLKQEANKDLFVFGSGILSESLLNAGLFDELRLCIAPVILGGGRRLFTDKRTQNLSVKECTQLKNGGILLKYDVLNQGS